MNIDIQILKMDYPDENGNSLICPGYVWNSNFYANAKGEPKSRHGYGYQSLFRFSVNTPNGPGVAFYTHERKWRLLLPKFIKIR